MNPLKTIFEVKGEDEILLLSFDFGAGMNEGEVPLAAEVTAEVYSGTDAAPEDLIDGSATISGSVVTQSVIGGTAGVQYRLTCGIGSNLGQSLIQQAFLTVESD